MKQGLTKSARPGWKSRSSCLGLPECQDYRWVQSHLAQSSYHVLHIPDTHKLSRTVTTALRGRCDRPIPMQPKKKEGVETDEGQELGQPGGSQDANSGHSRTTAIMVHCLVEDSETGFFAYPQPYTRMELRTPTEGRKEGRKGHQPGPTCQLCPACHSSVHSAPTPQALLLPCPSPNLPWGSPTRTVSPSCLSRPLGCQLGHLSSLRPD